MLLEPRVIKYNHLAASCMFFHNMFPMSQVLHELEAAGTAMDDATLTALCPCIIAHTGGAL
jgi:hypothetical protein